MILWLYDSLWSMLLLLLLLLLQRINRSLKECYGMLRTHPIREQLTGSMRSRCGLLTVFVFLSWTLVIVILIIMIWLWSSSGSYQPIILESYYPIILSHRHHMAMAMRGRPQWTRFHFSCPSLRLAACGTSLQDLFLPEDRPETQRPSSMCRVGSWLV